MISLICIIKINRVRKYKVLKKNNSITLNSRILEREDQRGKGIEMVSKKKWMGNPGIKVPGSMGGGKVWFNCIVKPESTLKGDPNYKRQT